MSILGSALGGLAGLIATDRASDAAVGASREAIDLQREVYDQNREDLAPYRETGTAALGQLAQLLGISAPQTAPVAETPAPTGEYTLDPAQLAQVLQPYLEGNPAEISRDRQYILDNFPELVDRINAPEPTVTLSPVEATVAEPVLAEPTASTELVNPDYSPFFETPGYQFTLNEALTANEGRAAARGRLSSSATDRSNIRYATGLADQTYNNYLNRLASMAGIGQTANTATAGLGANFANSAGTNIANAGTARASGYLGQANTINNALNSYMNYSAYNNLANSLYGNSPNLDASNFGYGPNNGLYS